MPALEINHFFTNRLYIGANPNSDLEKEVVQNGVEQKGAGVRSYGQITGWILSKLGYASKIEIDNKTFYVNNQSFVKLVIRMGELKDPTSAKDAAVKLNNLYHLHMKTGYQGKKVNEMCVQLLNRLKSTETQLKYIKSRKDIDVKVVQAETNRFFMELISDLMQIAAKSGTQRPS